MINLPLVTGTKQFNAEFREAPSRTRSIMIASSSQSQPIEMPEQAGDADDEDAPSSMTVADRDIPLTPGGRTGRSRAGRAAVAA